MFSPNIEDDNVVRWTEPSLAPGSDGPSMKKNHSITQFNGLLYCFGGYDGRHNHNTLLLYSLKDQVWVCPQYEDDMADDRAVMRNPTGLDQVMRNLTGLEDDTAVGHEVMRNPTGLDINVSGRPPPGRNGHTATLVTDAEDDESGRIIIIGGWLGSGPLAASDVHVLDITQNRQDGLQLCWHQPAVYGTVPGPCNMHTADYVASRRQVYIFRGGNGREYLNDLHALNTDTFKWRKVETTGPVPQQRANHSSAVIDNELFVFGGWNGTERLNDIYILDTESSTWTCPDVGGVLPHPRAGATLTALGGRLYLFGGSGSRSECFQDLQILDRNQMMWLDVAHNETSLDDWEAAHSSTNRNDENAVPTIVVEGQGPARRAGHAATAVNGRYLYVFGGSCGYDYLNDLFVLNTDPAPLAAALGSSEASTRSSSPNVEDDNASDDSQDEELRRIIEHTIPTEGSTSYPNSDPRETGCGAQSSDTLAADPMVYEDESDVVLALAQQNYETFYKLKPGTVTAPILEHSSAGIAGWASCVLHETPSKAESEQDDSNKKRKLATESPSTKPPPRPRRCDEEEARELQLALLESLGVDVGVEAKRSLLHDADYEVNGVGDESENEGDWSVEEDRIGDLSLEPGASDEGLGNGETGLSPLTEGLCIDSSENEAEQEPLEADSRQGSASGFVVVWSQGKSHPTDTSSSNEEADSHLSQIPDKRRSVANDLLHHKMQLAMVGSQELNGQESGKGSGSVTGSIGGASRASRTSRTSHTRSQGRHSSSMSKRSKMTVIAPPGKLGIILANKADSKGTMVSGVRTSSVLAEKISPGDRIIAIDGEDVSLMTVSEITAIMARKSDLGRELTVTTTPKHLGHTSESGLSPLTKSLPTVGSEDDGRDSAKSFVNVPAPRQLARGKSTSPELGIVKGNNVSTQEDKDLFSMWAQGGADKSPVVTQNRKADTAEGAGSDATSEEEADRNSESGLSPLAQGLQLESSSEDDSQDSAESFVNVPTPLRDDAASSSSSDWTLL